MEKSELNKNNRRKDGLLKDELKTLLRRMLFEEIFFISPQSMDFFK
jgi:hypothetical protein